MEIKTATQRLSALAQEGRLFVFRELVKAGPNGLAAGDIAKAVGVAANTLSAQLNILSHAGLIQSRREGRSIIYSIQYHHMSELLVYLVKDCCQGHEDICGPLSDMTTKMACC